jgi:hypothetical protein
MTTMTGPATHTCADCDQLITEQDWPERHTTAEGHPVHADCCPICNRPTGDTNRARVLRLIVDQLADREHDVAPHAIERLADAIVDRLGAEGFAVRRAP